MSKYEILLAAYGVWKADLARYVSGEPCTDYPVTSPYICDCIESSGEFRRTTDGNFAELTKEVSAMIDGRCDVVEYLRSTRSSGVGQYVNWRTEDRRPVLGNYDLVVTAYRSGIWAGLLEKYKEEPCEAGGSDETANVD